MPPSVAPSQLPMHSAHATKELLWSAGVSPFLELCCTNNTQTWSSFLHNQLFYMANSAWFHLPSELTPRGPAPKLSTAGTLDRVESWGGISARVRTKQNPARALMKAPWCLHRVRHQIETRCGGTSRNAENPYFSGITCIGDRTGKTFNAWRIRLRRTRPQWVRRKTARATLYRDVRANPPMPQQLKRFPSAGRVSRCRFLDTHRTKVWLRFQREPGCVPGPLFKSFESVACGSPLRRAYRP